MILQRTLFTFVLLAFLATLGCTATATKLNALKANYNAGNYAQVLGEEGGDEVYSADDVIKDAKKNGDQLTLTQAELIKARAKVGMLISSNTFCKTECPASLTEAITIVKDLQGQQMPYAWMQIEMAAMVADAHHINNQKVPSFYAYDYILNHFDFSEMPSVLMGYVAQFADAYEQAMESSVEADLEKDMKSIYQRTLKELTKKYTDNPGVLYAEVMGYLAEGNINQAVQHAMLARAFIAFKTSYGKRLREKMDKQICDELKNPNLAATQRCAYSNYLRVWGEKFNCGNSSDCLR